jgi:cytochrome c oxidase subunit 2
MQPALQRWRLYCVAGWPMPSAPDIQSVLSPASTQASSINTLWWLMLSVSAFVFTAVLAFVLVALFRGMRHSSGAALSSEKSLFRGVGVAVGVTVALLVGLLFASVWVGRSVASLRASSAVSIAVTGHQWWWEVEYEDAVPNRRVLTANEIHVPTNQPVVLKVTSRDVIHSFWAPNLQGKRDLIPGYTTAIWLQADRTGYSAASAPSFAVSSTRTWRLTWSPSPPPISTAGSKPCGSRHAPRRASLNGWDEMYS